MKSSAPFAHIVNRRRFCLLAGSSVVAACGGGGSGPALDGSTTQASISSAITGAVYPLSIYLPPASAGNRATLPIVYALDGEWWFQNLVDIAEAAGARIIVVGIGNQARRGQDYVPANSCTTGGGGQAAYLAFLTQELIPHVERTVGGDPDRRALLGHSHGGSFVYYALFAEPPTAHHFSAYLASDASIGCMPSTVGQWEQSYAAAYAALPVRLHISFASGGNPDNGPFAEVVRGRAYTDLTLQTRAYTGSHTGIIPTAFADAVAFAF
jgi:enterochelin esterase-like enzyme